MRDTKSLVEYAHTFKAIFDQLHAIGLLNKNYDPYIELSCFDP